jgi:hypothetical protein
VPLEYSIVAVQAGSTWSESARAAGVLLAVASHGVVDASAWREFLSVRAPHRV